MRGERRRGGGGLVGVRMAYNTSITPLPVYEVKTAQQTAQTIKSQMCTDITVLSNIG